MYLSLPEIVLCTLFKTYRAIDLNSLLGYMGGYVGVLLGFSILQIPDLLLAAIDKIKELFLVGKLVQTTSSIQLDQ